MGTPRALGAIVVALATAAAAAPAAESTFTTRLGEQDTCKVRGVTTLSFDAKAGLSRIRFDVSALPAGTKVHQALLRFWVACEGEGDASWKAFGFARWQDRPFEGLKVWRGPAPEDAKLLDTRFPFHVPTHWCFEFDVTKAVRAWVTAGETNDGLCANFAFPVGIDGAAEQAWLRPHLQVTCTGSDPDRPKQPTELKAFYRHGQVFLTWRQGPHTGAFFDATCRVYRSDKPITAAGLGAAELLGEVHRLSQLHYRRTLTARGGVYGPWRYYASAAGIPPQQKGENDKAAHARALAAMPRRFNFVIDDAWPQRIGGGTFLTAPEPSEAVRIHQGPQLADDAGLFVHTVRRPGKAYYAVTSVLNGNENRGDFAPGNALAEPVEGRVAEPRPVLQAVFTANGSEGYGKIGKFQHREYVYWSGGDGRLHNEPSTPFAFRFEVPRRWVGMGHAHNEDRDAPPWIRSNAKVAGYSVSYWNGGGLVMDTGYVPPTRLAPFPPGRSSNMTWAECGSLYYGSAAPPAEARAEPGPWWFCRDAYGYVSTLNTGADPRRALVVPYFENRRLFELDYVLSAFPADANYVSAEGEGSTLNFAIHHAERLGCADSEQEHSWSAPVGPEERSALAGLGEWQLRNDAGENAWQWNDPIWLSRRFPDRPWPCISHTHSPNYNSADNWNALGFPRFYLNLGGERRVAQLWWCDIGDAPAGKFLAVPRNEAYPVLSNMTCGQVPQAHWKDEPRGSLNGYVVWHRPARPWMRRLTPEELAGRKDAPPAPAGRTIAYADGAQAIRWAAIPLDLVDRADRFEVALRIGEEGLILNGQSVPPCRVACGAADITPRRCQRFAVAKGRQYVWQNVKVATGQVLQAGVVCPDDQGRLTAPQFLLDKDILGNKLILAPAEAAGAPPVDRSRTVRIAYFRSQQERHQGRNEQVEDLPYEDYLRRCTEPELVPVARPDKVFRIDDFVNARGFRGDEGLYSMWGGGFDDAFQFHQGGAYRVEVRTTRSCLQNGAWPILSLAVDDRDEGERLLDANAPLLSTWWIDVPKGRHRVRFRLANNVFNEPVPRNGDQSPLPDRGFTLIGVRFLPLPPPPADAEEVYEVRIRQRSLTIAPGMAAHLAADVLDPWGRPARAPVAWTASAGATISADGTFRADRQGAYTVTAAAGKTDSVVVTVGGKAWHDDFDDEWPDGWRPVVPAGAPGQPTGAWMVTRQTGFIGVLCQRQRDAAASHAIVWEAGADWTDLAIQVDCPRGEPRLEQGPMQGVIFRHRDADNHCRFEKHAAGGSTELRLVARIAGKETVVASVGKEVPPLAMSRKDCPSFRHWSDRHRDDPAPFHTDRFQVELRGRRVVAKLNGQLVFDTEHPGPASGTVGLVCRGPGAFDNPSAQPVNDGGR